MVPLLSVYQNCPSMPSLLPRYYRRHRVLFENTTAGALGIFSRMSLCGMKTENVPDSRSNCERSPMISGAATHLYRLEDLGCVVLSNHYTSTNWRALGVVIRSNHTPIIPTGRLLPNPYRLIHWHYSYIATYLLISIH